MLNPADISELKISPMLWFHSYVLLNSSGDPSVYVGPGPRSSGPDGWQEYG